MKKVAIKQQSPAMTEIDKEAARYEVQQYYDDGLITYQEYSVQMEAINAA